MRAQADLFAALTAHPTLVGDGRQEALAELLRQVMPGRFEVLSGTVAVLDDDQQAMRSTRQIDILVADTMDFPTLMRTGNVAVVLAQSVQAAIEVKSNLRRGASFVSAIAQIARTRELLGLSAPVFTALFSFGAPAGPDTLRDWLADVVALRELLVTGQAEPSIVRLRDSMLGSLDGSVRFADETELLATLENHNLPDVIAADRGRGRKQDRLCGTAAMLPIRPGRRICSIGGDPDRRAARAIGSRGELPRRECAGCAAGTPGTRSAQGSSSRQPSTLRLRACVHGGALR